MSDRRVEKTKKAIREAYVALILEKDTPKITITEIAKKANIDRKTFYLHYASVEDIIHEFAKEQTEALIFYLEQNAYFDDTSDVDALFRSLNSLLEENRELHRHIARTPAYTFLWEQIKDILKDSLIETMEDRLDIPREELGFYMEFYAFGIIGVYREWLRGEFAISDSRLAEIVGDAAFYGLQKLLSKRKETDQHERK